MNRYFCIWRPSSVRMPHMRGDEPDYVAQLVQQAVVCPTCVGMNRQPSADESANLRMPHMRGDEPYARRDYAAQTLYAPHAWG